MSIKKSTRHTFKMILVYGGLLMFLITMLLPMYFAIVTSVKPDVEIYAKERQPLWVFKPTIDHYIYLLEQTQFKTWLKNSLIVSVSSTAIAIVVGSMAAYALARLRFKGKEAVSTIIFITYLVPTTLLFLPMAYLIRQLGLYDKLPSLILTYPTFLIPFTTLLMIGYFRGIPKELEECATVDGATRIQALWYIVLPLTLPGLVSSGLFAFTMSWNEFIYALTFTQTASVKTITVGVVSQLVLADVFFWGSLMAAAVIGSIPIVILYSFFLEYYVKGMTAGAVKG